MNRDDLQRVANLLVKTYKHEIVECGDWEITDAEIELDHHPDCPAVDGFGCRCSEIEEVNE